MAPTPYTGEDIHLLIEPHRERLFASYAAGRLPTWSCDQRTKDIICLSLWLREELAYLDELGRKTLEGEFNRYSRSDLDLFDLAANILNKAKGDDIDRDRKTHHRWG